MNTGAASTSGDQGAATPTPAPPVVADAPATPAPAIEPVEDSQGKHSDSNTQVQPWSNLYLY